MESDHYPYTECDYPYTERDYPYTERDYPYTGYRVPFLFSIFSLFSLSLSLSLS